jgi:UDP-N-acetylglucosamine--N-acetylmuramyl-(pentapeptide) pyrophosphoryl-undecaprenol N-acetylglucosamine transferase
MNQKTAHKEPLRVAISGGGTGGHLFPALAIAKALQAKVRDTQLLFVGAKGRMEMEKVPAHGYTIRGLWIAGMIRGVSLKNLLLPLKVVVSFIQAWQILWQYKPHIAIGTGGFASGPLLFVAARMGIPTLIQEQNFFPGLTTRLLAPYVDRVCGVYEELAQYFNKDKLVITGNPVRSDLRIPETSARSARKRFGLASQKRTFLSIGGSLGATTLNQAMEQTIPQLNQDEMQGIWQCGKTYYTNNGNYWLNNYKTTVTIQPFIEDMPLAYKAADVVIARAGAITLAELAYLGKAAILVPSPNVAADHQTKNAAVLADHDAAILIPDEEAAKQIPDVMPELLNNPKRLEELGNNITAFAKPDATENIAKEIFDLVNHSASESNKNDSDKGRFNSSVQNSNSQR